LDNARAIVERARQAGRVHAVVQNRRYVANVRRIRRFLDSGVIGAPTSIHADFFVAPHCGGFREQMRHVLLLDMAIHTFDAARYMVNSDPKRAFCLEWEPTNSRYTQGSSATAVFEFGGGKVFTCRGSWRADGFRSSWEAGWRIIGERGSLTWDGFDGLKAEVATPEREGLFDRLEPACHERFYQPCDLKFFEVGANTHRPAKMPRLNMPTCCSWSKSQWAPSPQLILSGRRRRHRGRERRLLYVTVTRGKDSLERTGGPPPVCAAQRTKIPPPIQGFGRSDLTPYGYSPAPLRRAQLLLGLSVVHVVFESWRADNLRGALLPAALGPTPTGSFEPADLESGHSVRRRRDHGLTRTDWGARCKSFNDVFAT
jgi:hypothetical protein